MIKKFPDKRPNTEVLLASAAARAGSIASYRYCIGIHLLECDCELIAARNEEVVVFINARTLLVCYCT